MQVKLWGVRGSLAAPLDPVDYRSRLRSSIEHALSMWRRDPGVSADDVIAGMPEHIRDIIGGDTTCVELRSGDEQLIFDMGTGARRLGYDMMSRGMSGPIHILMTHTHWDHIQGWPFFVPAYIPSNHVHLYSCFANCEDRFVRQQQFDFFPMAFDEMGSKREFHLFKQGDSFDIGAFRIRTAALIHPGQSTAYRIERDGRSFIFATDTEFFGPGLAAIIAERRVFFQDADVLVIDAQYSVKEAEQKVGWGHTAMTIAVECAIAWNVKRLVLTHHEPAHDDATILEMFAVARKFLESHADAARSHGLQLILARQGETIEV